MRRLYIGSAHRRLKELIRENCTQLGCVADGKSWLTVSGQDKSFVSSSFERSSSDSADYRSVARTGTDLRPAAVSHLLDCLSADLNRGVAANGNFDAGPRKQEELARVPDNAREDVPSVQRNESSGGVHASFQVGLFALM